LVQTIQVAAVVGGVALGEAEQGFSEVGVFHELILAPFGRFVKGVGGTGNRTLGPEQRVGWAVGVAQPHGTGFAPQFGHRAGQV
jgi:hypothetical protein